MARAHDLFDSLVVNSITRGRIDNILTRKLENNKGRKKGVDNYLHVPQKSGIEYYCLSWSFVDFFV